MKVVKYNDKIVKYDEHVVIIPDEPLNYSTHSLKYSTANCSTVCGIGNLTHYYCEAGVTVLSINDVIYIDKDLTSTQSGYYGDNTSCYWVDGDGIIVQIDEC